ncbi:MAG: FecR domain-containing protein, partial [Xanthomonadales bacterium]|nr:FecR domain-containing protein [Xanthomonadales bacterium]
DAGPSLAQPGADLYAGQKIETAGGRLALRWRDGSSVRIDEHTTMRLAGDGAAELVRGRVYVDAGASNIAAKAPVVLTPAGPVRHIGTQYMISVEGVSVGNAGVNAGATRVSVREGRVALAAGGAQQIARAGQELAVGPDGQGSLRPIPVWGDPWLWADALAAPFDADGQSVADFLAWVARETGRRVEFASAAAEQQARATELRGAIELEPMRALELVLQTSDLVARVDNGIIRVSLRTEE